MKGMVLDQHPQSSYPTQAAAEFDRLMRQHIPSLFRSAYRWTGSVDRAEDLVQELLVRLYPKLEELKALDKVRPWALRVMYRIFIDQIRRERNAPVQFGMDSQDEGEAADEEENHLIDQAAGPPELVEQELTQERIAAVWILLGEEHRAVLAMHDIEDYSLPELSVMLEVPIGTLKSRLHRARARLRELLARNDSPGPTVYDGE